LIRGIGASEGISIGKVFRYDHIEVIAEKNEVEDTALEIERFQKGLTESIVDLTGIKDYAEENINAETAAIFEAHIEILKDPEFANQVKEVITTEGINGEYGLEKVTHQFVSMFENMDNEYFRERAADIKDVSRRVLMHMKGIKSHDLSEINSEVILAARDLTPSDTAQLNRKWVKGFIADIGGRTSHSAIMARTLEIPAVVGTMTGFDSLEDGEIVILDGMQGIIIQNPDESVIADYQEKIKELEALKTIRAAYVDKPSLTADGLHIEIGANIGSPEDLDGVLSYGAECIGLYRTEFLYMGKKTFPTEDEQFEAYKKVLEGMKDKPVVVRTLDIGGDKELDYMTMEKELNPFLGNRAIRLCLSRKELFLTQLKALLRASVYGNLHIMFPMIATIDELREAKQMIQVAKEELQKKEAYEELEFSYKIGIMVEIPSTAIMASAFAKEVDFFSIGTNDLIQYTFAADRMNENVSYLYQPFNPAILKLVKMVIEAAHAEGKWVGMCGEMAGEPLALPLLIGLGLDEYSMSAPGILRARQQAETIDSNKARDIAQQALELTSQEDVLALIGEITW
jgi:phosphotransferase system enzyme I (PtsI)